MAPKTTTTKVPGLPGRKTIIAGSSPASRYAYREIVGKGRDLAEVARDDFRTNDPGKVWLAVEVEKVALGAAGDERYAESHARIAPDLALAAIARYRDADLLSWGSVSARSGVTETRLRSAYRENEKRSEKVGLANSVAVRRAKRAGEDAAETTAAIGAGDAAAGEAA
jgi:hypothetical protein